MTVDIKDIFNKLINKKEDKFLKNEHKYKKFIYSLFFVICKARSAYLIETDKFKKSYIKIILELKAICNIDYILVDYGYDRYVPGKNILVYNSDLLNINEYINRNLTIGNILGYPCEISDNNLYIVTLVYSVNKKIRIDPVFICGKHDNEDSAKIIIETLEKKYNKVLQMFDDTSKIKFIILSHNSKEKLILDGDVLKRYTDWGELYKDLDSK